METAFELVFVSVSNCRCDPLTLLIVRLGQERPGCYPCVSYLDEHEQALESVGCRRGNKISYMPLGCGSCARSGAITLNNRHCFEPSGTLPWRAGPRGSITIARLRKCRHAARVELSQLSESGCRPTTAPRPDCGTGKHIMTVCYFLPSSRRVPLTFLKSQICQ